ncbi:MAG: sulfite exporter TauE/SafE family protein [Phycisphaeraceae bacterium]|nr:sulfite exporter TauE/SafE family protein [Phycisphaerae bacterium]MBX3393215.1 sulfite exporter TauE/SafE family protein [Phycisphaeraceae bacterium]
MTPLFAAVFTASLLGSMHCAGMCGAFVAFAVAGFEGSSPAAPSWILNAAYNGGRLVTYSILGAIAGAVGSAVDLGGGAVGVSNAAAITAGAFMACFGVVMTLRALGVRIARAPLPPMVDRVVAAGHRAALGLNPRRRALVIGLLTTLLPCGWLYAFAVTAAGTADPLMGAATMAAFWAGTLPVMASIGAGIRGVAGPLRDRLPAITAVFLVAVGCATIVGRIGVGPLSGGLHEGSRVREAKVPVPGKVELPCCHAE